MRRILSLSIVLLFACCCGGAEGDKQKPETSTVVYRTIVKSVRQLQSKEELTECKYWEKGAQWRVELRVRAVCGKDGWKRLPAEGNLVVAVRDAAGDFGLFSGDEDKPLDLLVTIVRQTGTICGILRAPPDLVPQE